MVGLARIDAFEGRTEEAIAGLRRAAAIAPQPETMALLGDLLSATGDTGGAAARFATVRLTETFGHRQIGVRPRPDPIRTRPWWGHRGDPDGPDRGLREPTRPGHDVVAWALYRTDRLADADRASALAKPRVGFAMRGSSSTPAPSRSPTGGPTRAGASSGMPSRSARRSVRRPIARPPKRWFDPEPSGRGRQGTAMRLHL